LNEAADVQERLAKQRPTLIDPDNASALHDKQAAITCMGKVEGLCES
jgi:hypothetical protein